MNWLLAAIGAGTLFFGMIASWLIVNWAVLEVPKNKRLIHHGFEEVCMEGVVYYKGTYVLTPKFTQDKKLYHCNP